MMIPGEACGRVYQTTLEGMILHRSTSLLRCHQCSVRVTS